MKRFFKKLCFYSLLLTPLVGCLGYLYQDELAELTGKWSQDFKENQQRQAIRKYGAGLPPVDEVWLFRLTEKVPEKSFGTYRLAHQKSSRMHIANKVTLKGEEAQELARVWRSLRLHNDSMAACYDPHHVIQFRAGGRILADAVVCFDCGNTSLPAFPFHTLVSFEAALPNESPDYLLFKQHIETLVGKHDESSKP